MGGEPDPVLGEIERVSLSRQARGIHFQNNRFAAAIAHGRGGLDVARQMHMAALHRQQTLIQDFVSRRGGGFLMLGGLESFQQGKYKGK